MPDFSCPTRGKADFVDITGLVADIVGESDVDEGIAHVFVPHTTAGVTINENADPDVVRDMKVALDRIVPDRGDFSHAEGNSPAHVKASLMGSSVTVPISGGRLALGTWQGIYLCEFDGPRTRRVRVAIVRS